MLHLSEPTITDIILKCFLIQPVIINRAWKDAIENTVNHLIKKFHL